MMMVGPAGGPGWTMSRVYPADSITMPTVGGETCLTFVPTSLIDIVRDGSGNAHLIYVATITTGVTYPFDRPFMFHQKSIDDGATWTDPVHIGGTTTPSHENYFLNAGALVACTDDLDGGKIYAYMVGSYITDIRLFQIASADSGATWGDITSVYQETDDGDPDLLPQYYWHRATVRGNRRVVPTRIDDYYGYPVGALVTSNGSTWTRVGVLAASEDDDNEKAIATAIGSDDTIHFLMQGADSIKYRPMTGTTRGALVTLSSDATAWYGSAVAIQAATSSDIRAVYHIEPDGGGTWADSLWLFESADSGATFPTSYELSITDDYTEAGAVAVEPNLAFVGTEIMGEYTAYDAGGTGARKVLIQTTGDGQVFASYSATEDDTGIAGGLWTTYGGVYWATGALTLHQSSGTILINRWTSA